MPIPVEPVRAAGGLLSEFRAFALRGSLVDLAVGVVAGAAFTRLIDALVRHMFLKLLEYVLPAAREYEGGVVGNVEVGRFLGELLYFLVVAFAVFFVVAKVGRVLVKARREEEAAVAAAAVAAAAKSPTAAGGKRVVPEDVALLTEIRDLLRQQQQLLDARIAQPRPRPPSFEFGAGDEDKLI